METAEIKRRWLAFFAERGHTVVPSAPLILDDPNLLFVNAGMVPFKPYFLGQEAAPYKRATSVQKCMRTVDIDEVGRTSRHGSFFQMNGNFSFGDYFKRGAIELAWELVTTPQDAGGYGLDPDQLWVTVYHEDDEAAQLWRDVAGLPAERIVRRGMKDNFWSMGVPGPCGPCSEIFVDRGPEYGPPGGPEVDEDRYMEIWNLVFMQYIRGEGGGKEGFPILGELPAKNIDTGMGLERMASILQGVDNLYEIDEVYPVIDRASAIAGRRYGADPDDDVRLRVVADHVRTALMLIADGVVPGNEGRGYVLRRMLRRTVRSMRLLGVDRPALPDLLPVSRDAMAPSYPQLATDFARISAVAYAEEEAFAATLRAGTAIFETAVAEAREEAVREETTGAPAPAGQPGAVAGGPVPVIPGERAFQLHDTYGFPIDLTLEMAAEAGVQVDEEGFRRLMEAQRQRAKADAAARKTGHLDLSAYRAVMDRLAGPTAFTGYDEVLSETTIAAVLVGGVSVPAVGPDTTPTGAGSAPTGAGSAPGVEIILERTPFYAEGGGQLADTGWIRTADGAVAEVFDVQSPVSGLIVHRARVVDGEVIVGAPAHAEVDVERRRSISRAHTATHMVHKAIREAVGETATQAGSENAPGRFRFDFTATSAVPPSVLRDVEDRVNAQLLADLPVHADVMSLHQAREIGAMALFGEKYGERVRVVSVGDWSRELCGGTHARHSAQLGVVKLLGESSIGAGVRRVEALVGADAYHYLAREHALVGQLTDLLKTRPEDLPDRVAGIVTRLREAEKELERVRAAQLLAAAPSLATGARDVYGVSLVTHQAPDGTSVDDLRRLALDVRGRLPADRPGVVAVGAVTGGRPVLVVAVNERSREWRVRAGELVRRAATVLGGGGGGKDDIAQGGGSDPTRLPEALSAIEHVVAQSVTAS